MRDIPILFSAPMVRAIQAGRKTQTRRIVKLPHNNPLGQWEPTTIGGENGGRTAAGETVPLQAAIWHTRTGDGMVSPHGQPGDRLWVRETTRSRLLQNQFTGEPTNALCGAYVADDEPVLNPDGFDLAWWYSRKTCPAIHMPRAACRIELEVTGVRVEQLNDCSFEDALAEGIPDYRQLLGDECINGETADECARRLRWPQRQYAQLWDEINGAGAWDTNPWVWVIEFRRLNQGDRP